MRFGIAAAFAVAGFGLAAASSRGSAFLRNPCSAQDRREGSELALLQEVLDLLREHYHDPERIDKELPRMLENAAQAMLSTLDPHMRYLNEPAFRKEQQEDLQGTYGGIGIRLGVRYDREGTAWPFVESLIYSGPAFRSGLRSGDRIIEIDGRTTANLGAAEAANLLQGEPGTKVRLKVSAARFDGYRDFEIPREEIELEGVFSALLPGKIAYFKLTGFGRKDGDILRERIRNLADAKAIVLDLRGNPGGLADTANEVANLFLDRGRQLCTEKAKNPAAAPKTILLTQPAETNLPMAVLVDAGSASASEVVAGALRDHKRARLVGTRTYGKGSAQTKVPLQSTERRCAISITGKLWVLPGGESVEKDDRRLSGIEPDVVVPPAPFNPYDAWEKERIRGSEALEKYVEEEYPKHRALFDRLSEWDGNDSSRYPGFDDLLNRIQVRGGPARGRELLREALRERLRMRVQDERQQTFACDYQADRQLRAAVREAARAAGVDLSDIEEFRGKDGRGGDIY